jgi:hypothetical protein
MPAPRSALRAAAAGGLALLVAALPFAWWSPAWGVLVALSATAAVAWLYPGRRAAPALFAAFAVAATWLLLFTWRGYYWTHAGELRALAAEVAAYPRIRDLELGSDGSYTHQGRVVRYDDYRFLNGTRVTHYRGAHQPGAHQPVWFVDEYLQRHGISRERYLHFRRALARLRLQGYTLEPDGTVSFTLRNQGGDPVVTTLDYLPRGGTPDSPQYTRVGRHWFVVENG